MLSSFELHTGDETYDTVLDLSLMVVPVVAAFAAFVEGPYGRFGKNDRFSISANLGWFLMELPATVSFLYFFFRGEHCFELVPLVFMCVWLVHYGNRGFAFPYLIRSPKTGNSGFSLTVVIGGQLVTAVHGYLNAKYFSSLGAELYTPGWLTSPQFLFGIALYYFGYLTNIHSDYITRNLRTADEVARGTKVYRIPKGGLFEYVTNASYLSELLAWTGFVIATNSPGALFVWGISLANLIPRSFQTHDWYKKKFSDYPTKRRVLIPFLL